MLQRAMVIVLETNGKTEVESLRKEIEDTKKNQMEILDSKNTITKIKSSKNRLRSRREGTEERITDMEEKTIEISGFEQ